MGTKKEFEPIDEAIAELLGKAVTNSGMTYRALRDATGLSINRIGIILRKEPPPATMGEIGAIAGATGRDVAQLDSQPRYALSVLAHELGHYSLGHTCAQSRKGEALADEWAARLLIHPDEYQCVESLYGTNLYWLSFELGVSQRIVKAFQTTLAA